jgi:di/tricarboxylate transporter
MSFAAGFTLLVIGLVLAGLLLNVAPPDLLLLAALVVLLAGGVLTPADAFVGFANTGMLTVAALFVVAAGLRETGAISLMTTTLLGRPKTARGGMLRLVAPVISGSAFLNNTTIVAALMPAVLEWARRIQVPASRLLLPLSYASILGGVCTLIGTSTNLVVAGLVEDALGETAGLHSVGFFEVGWVGVPVALAGSAVVVVFGPWLLPDRRPAVSLADDPRHYTMEVLVPPDSRLAGQSIEKAGLRSLPGAFLMEIVRGGEVLPVVDAKERVEADDRLIFVGDVDAMVDLQRFPGLAAAPDQVFKLAGERHSRVLAEAVVAERNPSVGLSIREAGFRQRYRSVVIAVARAGERLPGRIGDIVLRTGDVLLLETQPDFVVEQRSRGDFYLVSQVDGARPPRLEKAGMALGILGAVVLAATLELVPTVVSAFVGAGAMLLTRCCTHDEARRSLDLPVLVSIAAAFGLGRAMQVSGLDAALASGAVELGASSPLVALIVVYFVTAALTELVTNNAAAVLAFPLAISVAERLDAQPMPFVFTVMIAASASFLTPIGYQTNLMVMGPGGYRPSDYLRLGLPLAAVTAVVTLTVVPLIWPL